MQQAMIIDLNKRRGGVGKKLEHALMDVGEWNAENPTHPRSPNGRFMSAAGASHEAVADLLHGLVKEHKAENTKLGQSILEHIGRTAEPRAPKGEGRKLPPRAQYEKDLQAWQAEGSFISNMHHEDDPVRAAKLRAHAERKPVELA